MVEVRSGGRGRLNRAASIPEEEEEGSYASASAEGEGEGDVEAAAAAAEGGGGLRSNKGAKARRAFKRQITVQKIAKVFKVIKFSVIFFYFPSLSGWEKTWFLNSQSNKQASPIAEGKTFSGRHLRSEKSLGGVPDQLDRPKKILCHAMLSGKEHLEKYISF